MATNTGDLIVRHPVGERVTHWAMAIAFVVLFLSGLAMFHPFFFWLSLLFIGSSLGLGTLLGQAITFVNPGRIVPKVHQFSLGVQRELPLRTVVDTPTRPRRTLSAPILIAGSPFSMTSLVTATIWFKRRAADSAGRRWVGSITFQLRTWRRLR